MLQSVYGCGLLYGRRRAEPAQPPVDYRLGQQIKMPMQPSLALLFGLVWKAQGQVGTDDMRPRAHQPCCQPAQDARPALAANRGAAAEISKKRAQEERKSVA